MTTTTHAPGPWAIEAPPITLPSAGWIIQDAIGNDVCEGVTTEANARLIAKAPELLAELRNLSAWLIAPDTSAATLRELRESIRKLLAEIEG